MSQEQLDAIYAQILDLLGDVDDVSPLGSPRSLRSSLRTAMLVAGVILPPLLTLLPTIYRGQGIWWLTIIGGAVAGACFVQLQRPNGIEHNSIGAK
jgi:hypothetical protein